MALRNRGGIWHYRFKFDGREYSGATSLAATARNTTAALRVEAEHRDALREGRQAPRRIVVREFNDAVVQFLEWAKMEYRAHPNSHHRVASSLSSAKVFFGREPVSLLDEGRLEAYKQWRVNEHDVKDITLRHDLHALSKFFGYAIKQRWARENPVRKVKLPSDADSIRIHVITAQEEKAYFERAAKQKDLHDLSKLMLNQGMRPEEVLSLRKEDVDLERGQLHVQEGKTSAARRTLDLIGESRRILAERLAGVSPWVFPSRRKPGAHVARLNSAHDRVLVKAEKDGLPLGFVLYDFRHTFATRMAQAGIDLATLAAILGHGSLRIVQRYVHPTAEHKRRAMARYDEALQAALGEPGQEEERVN
jgi:integrase